MHIRIEGNTHVMSELLVCPDYSDMKHFKSDFDRVEDNKYKCRDCGKTITVTEPVLIQDDKGRLKMQVSVEVEDKSGGK